MLEISGGEGFEPDPSTTGGFWYDSPPKYSMILLINHIFPLLVTLFIVFVILKTTLCPSLPLPSPMVFHPPPCWYECRLYFSREVPLELRPREGAGLPVDAGATENVKVKVLLRGEESAPDTVRVELSSEANLWFLYVHEMDQAAYHEVQDTQRLMLSFHEYPPLLVQMLTNCIRDPRQYMGILSMQAGFNARLDFLQVLEYKFIEHLSVAFEAAPEHLVKDHIAHRYNRLKSTCTGLQAALADMTSLIKARNPSLLLQFTNMRKSQGAGAGVDTSISMPVRLGGPPSQPPGLPSPKRTPAGPSKK